MRTCIVIAFLFCLTSSLSAQSGVTALTNARIETVTNGVIEQGTLVMRNGEIIGVGTNIAVPSDAEIIDCSGMTVYPGLD